MKKLVRLLLLLLLSAGVLLGAAATVWAADNEPVPAFTSLAELEGKRIGIQTGTTYDEMVTNYFSNVELQYFNTYSDMAAAVEAGKLDAFPGDEPAIRIMAMENTKLAVLDENIETVVFSFVLPKTEAGQALCAQLNEWIADMARRGELLRLKEKWGAEDESGKTMPEYSSEGPNGTLIMATEGAYVPLNYFRGTELVGLEVEMAALFCNDYGYGLEVQAINFDAIVPAVQSGKVNFAAAAVTPTPERAESALFSDPYYECATIMAVQNVANARTSLLGGILDSFDKTFLRESRWKLMLQGVGNTLTITVLSMVCGAALGFVTFLLCRRGSKIASGITNLCIALVKGMPLVVLLMILYYVVFVNKLAISGIAVAVVCFTLTFGAAVFGMLRMGVGAVDKGQQEASMAMGFSDRRTLYFIILPQALPHILPSLQSELVALIQSTAVVGYITVQDLTKMGDIIRSRTYEAFFPLIAVTVIYFLLEGLVGAAMKWLQKVTDPRRRTPEQILKGVQRHD